MSEFNPTTNRIQFGMMTPEEQAELREWPHDWEYYLLNEWRFIVTPSWEWGVVYRGKPAPVVKSAWWNVYPSGSVLTAYPTRKMADDNAGKNRIAVLRIDTCNGVSTAHLEDV